MCSSLRLHGRTCRCDASQYAEVDHACPWPCYSVALCGSFLKANSCQHLVMHVGMWRLFSDSQEVVRPFLCPWSCHPHEAVRSKAVASVRHSLRSY